MTYRKGRLGKNLAKVSFKSKAFAPTPSKSFIGKYAPSSGVSPIQSISASPVRPRRSAPPQALKKIDLENVIVYYDPGRETAPMWHDPSNFGPTIITMWSDLLGGDGFDLGRFPIGKKFKMDVTWNSGPRIGNTRSAVTVTALKAGKSNLIAFSKDEFEQRKLYSLRKIHSITDSSGRRFDVQDSALMVKPAHKKYMEKSQFGKYF
jgi:hypothetical protein